MRVKTLSVDEILEMSVEELRRPKALKARVQDIKGHAKPQLQKMFLRTVTPVSSPKKELVFSELTIE